MRAGLGVLLVIAISLPELARSQTSADADTDTALTIAIHPRVTTILKLSDEIMDTWIEHDGDIRVARVGNEIALRPRAGTPAGAEALLEVETRTGRRIFRLRVVKRTRDAHRDVLVLPPERRLDIERSVLLAPPVAALEPPAVPVEPAASTSTSQPGPAAPAGAEAAPMPAGQASEIATGSKPDTATTRAPRFDLSVHALAALGTTAFHVAGYQATNARQSHYAFGLRVAGHPHDTRWSVEGSISGELPITPTRHTDLYDSSKPVVEADGPRLRADGGIRLRFGTTLIPTFHAALGLQAHYLDMRAPGNPTTKADRTDLPFEGVMVLGMGLEYRAGDWLLGIDLHVRQGVPAGYRSVGAVLSVGCSLDQGEP